MPTPPGAFVVTGGNSGIGYETALELARRGHAVAIGARDAERLQAAVDAIRGATGNASVHGHRLDLSSLTDVHRFAAEVKAAHPVLAGIVCNAGITTQKFSWSADGYELTWATNHLGHFYLVQLLLPLLAAPARVVITSSGTHDPKVKAPLPAPKWAAPADVSMPKQALQGAPPAAFSGMQAYTNSKLCNVFHAYQLAARLQQQGKVGVAVAAYNPSFVPGTGIDRQMSRWQARVVQTAIPWLMWLRGRRPSTAAKSGGFQARLACDPGVAISGTNVYYDVDALQASSELSYDTAKAAEMWTYSEEALKRAGVPAQLS